MFSVIFYECLQSTPKSIILQKLCGHVATTAKCQCQCFQKERLRETHLAPLTLKAMITFISATYYLFLKPYNHD